MMKRCLIDKLGAGKVAAGFIDVNSVNTEKKTINTSIAKINKLLGIDVPVSVIKSVLSGLQFEVETDGDSLTVKVPPYREDIEDYPDLAEEIIRMYGYEHIQNKLLDNASITFGGRTYDQIKEVQTKKYLASVGFSEIVTYSFISPNDYKNFGLNPENLELIKLKNPLGEDMSVMRTTLIPSIAAAVARNLNKKNLNGRMFELAKIYIPKALPLTELPDERTTLAMSVFGSGEDFFTMKGAVEGLFENLCYAGEIKYEKSSVSYLHPTRSADIIANSKRIGYFGELHPKISEKLGIDKEIYVCEIDYQSIKDNFTREYSVKTFSKFPQVERDLALVCDKELSNLEIVEAIKSANIKTLTDIKLFDVYTGDKIEKNKKSLAYRLTFSSMEKTLGDEEIENYIRKILSKLSQIGAVLR